MKLNPLTAIDFYKADHRRQYPEGTTLVYSNLTPRSDKLSNIPAHLFDGRVVFFGLQYFVKHFLIDVWNAEFFGKPKAEVVERYRRRMDTALGVGAIPVEHVEALHDLGYLPICIKALPEGSRVPIKVPVLVIYNTHPEFFWLTNYLETVLSCYLWKPITSATVARHYRTLLDRYADDTGTDKGFVLFQAHDFSFRGLSGPEDAALSGAAHLCSFVGTDTVPAIDLIEDYYGGNAEKELIGCSVPATEHSVMCMGTKESEIETFRRLITQIYPGGIVSVVSDTWDFWRVVTEYAFAAVWAVALLLDGTDVTSKLFKPCGTVAGVIGLLLLGFDKWAWSIRYLHSWFVDRPYIKGTWKGVLVSSYIDPVTQKRVDPIEVYLVIRQTYSTIFLTLHTKESSSETISNSFTKGADGAYTVASIYRNTPQIDHRNHSPIHHGAMLIRVAGSPVTHLRAEYWTDRLTQGEIHLSERSTKLYYDFDSASKGTYEKTDPQDGS